MEQSTSAEVASWHSLPNEMRAMVYQNMNFQDSLNARQCFRFFDILSKRLSRKNPMEIYVKSENNDHLTIKLVEPDNSTDTKNVIMKWIVTRKDHGFCEVVRKNSKDITLSVKVIDEIEFVGNKRTYLDMVPTAAFLIVGSLFKYPLFDVKLLELDLKNLSCSPYFGLANWPLDVLVLKNCTDPLTKAKLKVCYCFNYRMIYDRTENVQNQNLATEFMLHRSLSLKALEFRLSWHTYEYSLMEEILVEAVTPRIAFLGYQKMLLESVTLGIQKTRGLTKRYTPKWNKIINDLMCLRAAYHIYPENYFNNLEENENYDETIKKLREGIDNPQLPLDLVALLPLAYLCRLNHSYLARQHTYTMLQHLIENMLEMEEPGLYIKLVEKAEWLYFRDDLRRHTTYRSPFFEIWNS